MRKPGIPIYLGAETSQAASRGQQNKPGVLSIIVIKRELRGKEMSTGRSEARNGGSPRRLVLRLSDGKVLPVVDDHGEEICVEELFPYGDGGPSPRPLRLWHPRSWYVPANTAPSPATPARMSGLKRHTADICGGCGRSHAPNMPCANATAHGRAVASTGKPLVGSGGDK